MSRRQSLHVIVDSGNPEAAGQCDRCGIWYQLRQLDWQWDWSGTQLFNKRILVCSTCNDRPQEQLRTIILPPDPPPILNARPPNFAVEE